MAQIKVAVINDCTVLKDEDIKPVVDALQAQVREDFAPVWRMDADLIFVPSGGELPMDAWWLVFLDHSDSGTSLGYHDESPLGFPQGKVFAGDDLRAGTSWSNTASHELLELLSDPEIVECTLQYLPDGRKRLIAREICDPCPEDHHGYQKNGVLVSDFVTPHWFVGWSQGYPGVKYDFLEKIAAPFQVLPGGYIGVMDIEAGASWTQIDGHGMPHRKGNTAVLGSRRERRKTPRNYWKRTTYP